MAKVEFNNKKMWESIFKYCPKEHLYGKVLNAALADQGLRWNGKEIVSIEPELGKDKWYVCIKDWLNINDDIVYKKGEKYNIKDEPLMRYSENKLKEHFRPATKEEIPQTFEDISRTGYLDQTRPVHLEVKREIPQEPKQESSTITVEQYKVPTDTYIADENGVRKINEYGEQEQESSDGELSEFEKVLEELIFKIDGDYAVFMQSAEPYIKEFEPKLIEAARKMLQPEIDAEIEKAYKNQDDVVYQRGYITGLEAHRDDLTKEILSRIDVDEMVENLSSFRFGTDTTIIEIYKSAIIDTINAIKGE